MGGVLLCEEQSELEDDVTASPDLCDDVTEVVGEEQLFVLPHSPLYPESLSLKLMCLPLLLLLPCIHRPLSSSIPSCLPMSDLSCDIVAWKLIEDVATSDILTVCGVVA